MTRFFQQLLTFAQNDPEIPSTNQMVASLLLYMAIGYGAYLWFLWWQGCRQKQARPEPVCFQNSRRSPVNIPLAPVLLAGFWIAIQLFAILQRQFTAQPAEPFAPDVQQLLMYLVLLPLGFGGFLLIIWEFTATTSQRLSQYFTLEDWKTDLQAGLELMLLALPPTMLLGAISMLWRNPENQHELLKILRQEPDIALIATIILVAAIVAPIIEELTFRVLLLNGLHQYGGLPRLVAVILLSIIFSVSHGPVDALQIFPLAMCLGWCLLQRQSFLAVAFAHCLFNSFMLALTILASGS